MSRLKCNRRGAAFSRRSLPGWFTSSESKPTLVNTKRFLRLLLAVTFLTAFEVFAPVVSSEVPSAAEILPASSPYGSATIITNIFYATNPVPRQNFDLIRPLQKGSEPFPLIIWIHGGAWMLGIKEWDNVKYLVRHGYAIASID